MKELDNILLSHGAEQGELHESLKRAILQLFQTTLDEIEAAMPKEKPRIVYVEALMEIASINYGFNRALQQQQAVFKQYKEEQINE